MIYSFTDVFLPFNRTFVLFTPEEICLGFAPHSESFAFATSLQLAQFPHYSDSFYFVRTQIHRTSNTDFHTSLRNKVGRDKPYLLYFARRDCLAALAFAVTPLEPYLSCGQLDNKAQDSALGSLAPNSNVLYLAV